MSVQLKEIWQEEDTPRRVSEVLRRQIHIQLMEDRNPQADACGESVPSLAAWGYLYIP